MNFKHFSRGSLRSQGDPFSLWSILARRGERSSNESDVDISHLFHGHEIGSESRFSIGADHESGHEKLTAQVIDRPAPPIDVAERRTVILGEVVETDEEEEDLTGLRALSLAWEGARAATYRLPLLRGGGLRQMDLRRQRGDDDGRIVRFITTEALTRLQVLSLFEAIVLRPEEAILLNALKIIEPTIERLASVGGERARPSGSGHRGGIVVKSSESEQRIPIGSMGDGIWRMLGIALCLVRTQDGILLIDEIDTGLHYSVRDFGPHIDRIS